MICMKINLMDFPCTSNFDPIYWPPFLCWNSFIFFPSPSLERAYHQFWELWGFCLRSYWSDLFPGIGLLGGVSCFSVYTGGEQSSYRSFQFRSFPELTKQIVLYSKPQLLYLTRCGLTPHFFIIWFSDLIRLVWVWSLLVQVESESNIVNIHWVLGYSFFPSRSLIPFLYTFTLYFYILWLPLLVMVSQYIRLTLEHSFVILVHLNVKYYLVVLSFQYIVYPFHCVIELLCFIPLLFFFRLKGMYFYLFILNTSF